MKAIVIFAALVAVALAAPPSVLLTPRTNPVEVAVIKEQRSDNHGITNSYTNEYRLSNGQFHEETGEIVKGERESRSGEESAIVRVRGSFGWVDAKTNVKYVVTYVADENGFQPQGAHLPVA